jgi:3-hydroxyacyl-[acyl-carrier-protein] dehydratase
MELTNDQVREILPHRAPFLLVDKVTDYVPGQWARAVKCVSAGDNYFAGHFPQRSVMPGVLIVEALAQTGGIALLTDPAAPGGLALLGGIRGARFKKPVLPGDVLELECHIVRRRGPVGVAEGTASVNGVTVCTAELTFALTPA